MKAVFCLLGAAVVVALSSCGSTNEPLTSGYDPLDSPGAGLTAPEVVEATGPQYAPGDWVETTIASTAYYRSVPRSNEQPQKYLASGTVLKVISTEGTYVQVELETGEVGFVPAIMVAEKPALGELPIVPVNPDAIYSDGLAPEPEIPALDVQPAGGAPDKIAPDSVIE